jgi:hypothetical protein
VSHVHQLAEGSSEIKLKSKPKALGVASKLLIIWTSEYVPAVLPSPRLAGNTEGEAMNRIAFYVFGALVVFGVSGFAVGDLPVISQATFQERVLAFNRRTLTEAYKQVGVRHPKWDNLVIQYLDSYAQFFTEPRKAPTVESLLAAGTQIIGLGCTDPLVLYCHGVAQDYCNDRAGAEQSLSAAATQLAKSKYPAMRQRFAASRMAYVCRNYGFKRQAEYEGWRTQVIALLVKSLQDGSYRANEQRIFMLHFEPDWNDLFLDKRDEVYQAIKTVDKIDPWILNVVEGNYWIADAWKARGSGWAKTVTEAGWKGFYASLAKARTNLTTAWEMHPDYPEAATRMIQVAKGEAGQREESPHLWFDRAILAQLDYTPAYREYTEQLLPRWGGSHEAMLNFGWECLDTRRFDTDIPWQYYVMVYRIVNDLDSPGTALWNDPAVYSNLQTMCEGYIKADNTPDKKTAYQSAYAAICWRTGHYDKARRILDDLGDKAEGHVFLRDFKTPFDAARTEIYALISGFADDLNKAQTLVASNNQTKAITLYKDIMERADGDTNIIVYTGQQIEMLKTAIKANQGDWIPLTIPKDLTGWTVRAGVWKVEDDGAATGESTREGLLLVFNQTFGPNVEIKGELEFVKAPYKFKVNGGLALGSTDLRPHDFYSCLLYQAEREVSAGKGRGFRGSARVVKPADVQAGNAVLMRTRNNRLTLVVNGSTVLNEVVMEAYEPDKGQRVGLGGYYWYPGAVLRFKNLQIRSLQDASR